MNRKFHFSGSCELPLRLRWPLPIRFFVACTPLCDQILIPAPFMVELFSGTPTGGVAGSMAGTKSHSGNTNEVSECGSFPTTTGPEGAYRCYKAIASMVGRLQGHGIFQGCSFSLFSVFY